MCDTLFSVLNLPAGIDPTKIILFADQVVKSHIRSEFGECATYYTFELGEYGTHPHLNILFQFSNVFVNSVELTEQLKYITGLSDIKTIEVNNVENIIEYMQKEDDHVAGDSSTTEGVLTTEDIYEIQAELSGAGSVQRRKRPRASDDSGPASKKRKNDMSTSSADLLLADVDRLLDSGLTSVENIQQYYWNKRKTKTSENQKWFRRYTQNVPKVKAHVNQYLKMVNKADAKDDILSLPYSTYVKWYECMQVIGKRRGVDFMRRLSLLLQPRKRTQDNCTAIVCVGPPRCGKSWCTNWAEWLNNLVHLKLKETGVGKFDPLLHNEIGVFDDPSPGDWLDDRQSFAAMCTGDPFSVKVYSAVEVVSKPVHVIIKCNVLPPSAEDKTSMIGRRVDIFRFDPSKRHWRGHTGRL